VLTTLNGLKAQRAHGHEICNLMTITSWLVKAHGSVPALQAANGF
jgi:hypothetical protein